MFDWRWFWYGFFAGVLGAAIADMAFSSTWRVLSDETFGVPPGIAYTPVRTWDPPLQVDALRAELSAAEGCWARVSQINVDTDDSGRLHAYLPDGNGIVYLPHTQVYRSHVYLENPRSTDAACKLKISVSDDGGPDPSPTPSPTPTPTPSPSPSPRTWTLIGTYYYTGSFHSQELVRTPDTSKILAIQFKVPTFCAAMDVVELGYVSEGAYEQADATAEPGVFLVAGGSGARAQAVALTTNGPEDLRCDVPVYVERAP